MDVKVNGCRDFLKAFCFHSDKENSELVALDIDEDQKILFEYRDKFDFCAIHGLIRPPGYVILTTSDEEMNGVKAVERRRRFSFSSNEDDRIGSQIRELELVEVDDEDDSSGGRTCFRRANSIYSETSD